MYLVKKTCVLSRVLLAGLLLLAITVGAYAQSGERLGKIAILPFSGGTADEQEGIAELFSYTQEMMGSFNVIPRTTITNGVAREQSFQAMSGMTNADTIALLGKQFGAEYVMAGSITSLGSKNLLIVSVIKIDIIRQVAGDYLVYDSLNALNKDETVLNAIAARLVKMTRDAGKGLEMLALLPVQFSGGASVQEGDALAQLLAIYLLRAGKYAVYPRTKTLDQVQSEYDTQLLQGVTRTEEAVRLGEAVNPPYVLSVVSRKIGSDTRFNASIISLEGGNQIAGKSEQYANLSYGMDAMEYLARELSGETVSKKERSKLTNTVDREIAGKKNAEEAEAAARRRAAATDKFLKNAGIAFGGWLGWGTGGTGKTRVLDEEGNVTINDVKYTDTIGLSGGGNIELRLYRYFGIQTGISGITDYVPYTPQGNEEQYMKLSTLQIPVLARVNFQFNTGDMVGDIGWMLALFGGVGLNVACTSDAESIDLAKMNVIGGGEAGFAGKNFALFAVFQYNGGIDSGSITVDGVPYDGIQTGSYSMGVGFRIYLPFRWGGK
jgi:TolB-like protein